MLLREIEKTGKVLEAILLKLGVTTREKGEEAYDTARTRSAGGTRHGFRCRTRQRRHSRHPDRPATVSATTTSNDSPGYSFCSPPGHRTTTPAAEPASAAAALYQYLEGRSSCCFYDRYYILKELEKYL